mmetsp:Transcript_17563/g.24135  ORF Transcript_17563/g.24135 Transcript_17563/m.24135 type:complete len:253 (-) Transcript_17563:1532-2290(-)
MNDILMPSNKLDIRNSSKNLFQAGVLKESNNYVNKEMLLSAFDNVLLNISKSNSNVGYSKSQNNKNYSSSLRSPSNKLNEKKSIGTQATVPENEFKKDTKTLNIDQLNKNGIFQETAEHDDGKYLSEKKSEEVHEPVSKSSGSSGSERTLFDEYKLSELRKSCQQLKILVDCFNGIDNYIVSEGDLRSKDPDFYLEYDVSRRYATNNKHKQDNLYDDDLITSLQSYVVQVWKSFRDCLLRVMIQERLLIFRS